MKFVSLRKQPVMVAAALAAAAGAACGGDGAPASGGPPVGPGVALDAATLPVSPGDGGFVVSPDGPSAPGPVFDASQPGSPPSSGAWCAAKAVLDSRCNACHDGEGSAGTPMGLTKYSDLVADSAQYPGSKIYQRVGVRIHDSVRPMPPQGGLTPLELATLDGFLAGGAVGSDADTCAGDAGVAPPVVEEWPADCEEKYKFLAHGAGSAPFDVRVGEFYQDFTFTAPWTGDVQAVAFRPVVGNKRVLHHYILYQGTSSFLVGWSPGKAAEPLPADVGVHMPATGSLKLTVHYYNSGSGASATTDASGVEMCVTRKKRPHTATTMPFAANPSIAAGGQNVVNSSTCTVRASEDIHIVTSSPHMHKLGVHAKFIVQRANGQTEVIHDRPFNFEEQTTWPVDFVVRNGDRITTTCVYTNPGARSVRFGTSTDDEMCFNFSLYYPMCAMTCTQSDPIAQAWSSSQGGGCPQGASGGGGLLGN